MSDGQVRHMKGDIVPPDDWQHFNCECKNYASFPFHRLLFNEPIPLLEDWFEQIRDAADDGDVNILFMKITRIGKFVGFDATQPFKTNRHVVYTDKKGVIWKITEFSDFFDLNRATFETAHRQLQAPRDHLQNPDHSDLIKNLELGVTHWLRHRNWFVAV